MQTKENVALWKELGGRVKKLRQYCGLKQYEVGIGIALFNDFMHSYDEYEKRVRDMKELEKLYNNQPFKEVVCKIEQGKKDAAKYADALAAFFTFRISEINNLKRSKNEEREYEVEVKDGHWVDYRYFIGTCDYINDDTKNMYILKQNNRKKEASKQFVEALVNLLKTEGIIIDYENNNIAQSLFDRSLQNEIVADMEELPIIGEVMPEKDKQKVNFISDEFDGMRVLYMKKYNALMSDIAEYAKFKVKQLFKDDVYSDNIQDTFYYENNKSENKPENSRVNIIDWKRKNPDMCALVKGYDKKTGEGEILLEVGLRKKETLEKWIIDYNNSNYCVL